VGKWGTINALFGRMAGQKDLSATPLDFFGETCFELTESINWSHHKKDRSFNTKY
jgi:hypothetical protein